MRGYVCIDPVDVWTRDQVKLCFGNASCRVNKCCVPTRHLKIDEDVTLTGVHTGGAMALVHAALLKFHSSNIQVSVVSFNAPRVGDTRFGDILKTLGIKHIRVRNGLDPYVELICPKYDWHSNYAFDCKAVYYNKPHCFRNLLYMIYAVFAKARYSRVHSVDVALELCDMDDDFVTVDPF